MTEIKARSSEDIYLSLVVGQYGDSWRYRITDANAPGETFESEHLYANSASARSAARKPQQLVDGSKVEPIPEHEILADEYKRTFGRPLADVLADES